MEPVFCCVHTKESFFTNRLYVGLTPNKSEMNKVIFSGGKEKKGLGMTEYGCLLGRILTFLGYAFKSTDEAGNTLYINKKSFCNLVDRLHRNNQKFNSFNSEFVDAQYNAPKSNDDKMRIEKIYKVFDSEIKTLSHQNIAQVSVNILGKMNILGKT